MKTRVLLTGATGAIGLALLPELLDLGFIVYCLVRSQPGQSAEHRLRAVIRHPNAIAIDGDITKPLGGIDLTQLPPIDKFVHAAADTLHGLPVRTVEAIGHAEHAAQAPDQAALAAV